MVFARRSVSTKNVSVVLVPVSVVFFFVSVVFARLSVSKKMLAWFWFPLASFFFR